MKALIRSLALACLGAVSTGHACEYCLISQGISPLLTQNGAGIKAGQRYTLLDSVYEGSDKVHNPGVKEEYWTTELGAFYSLTERFLILVNAPIRKTKGDGELVEGPGGEPEREDSSGDASGLGDVSLLGRYTLYTRHTLDSTTLLAGVAGVKLPTGSTNQHNDDGEYLDAHLQLGTGSTDLLFGMSLTHVIGRYTLSSNLLAAFPGDGETGDMSHRFGNSLNYDLTGKYRLAPSVIGASTSEWFASFGVNGEYRRHEKLDGEKVGDSGGHTVYLTPGIQYQPGPHWVLEGTWQYAVYHDLNETQLGEDYKVFAGATYLF
jgi:Putative MetA-pathway of phenol degradation